VTPPSLVLLASRYRLGEPLGAGGMATVYDGFDERLHRPVAVKVLRPDMAARLDVRARFESEARSAAQLTHPNVVAVFDSGEDEGTPFLVMERLPGETLADRLQAGAVDDDWVLRVAGDVLGALGAAHAAGIVHRDVKPGNILIAADGCAKVGDFGIAKSLEVAAAADLTSTNQLVGTPAYVAPERVIGEPATIHSDLYAVGVVIYEAFAGRKPFTGTTPVATAYAIRHETPPALASVRPELAPHVVAAVERAMDRDPARRFGSAAEFASALGIGIAGVPATPPAADTDATVVADVSSTQVLPVAAAAESVPLAALVPGAGDTTGEPFLADRRRLLLLALAGVVVALLLFALAAAAGDDPSGSTSDTPTEPATTVVTTPPPTEPPTTVAPPAPAADTDPPKGKGKGKGKGDDDDDD
jgi:serine/threonine protein kinase